MSVAYGLISRELYRGMQFELEQKTGQCGKLNLSLSLSLWLCHLAQTAASTPFF